MATMNHSRVCRGHHIRLRRRRRGAGAGGRRAGAGRRWREEGIRSQSGLLSGDASEMREAKRCAAGGQTSEGRSRGQIFGDGGGRGPERRWPAPPPTPSTAFSTPPRGIVAGGSDPISLPLLPSPRGAATRSGHGARFRRGDGDGAMENGPLLPPPYCRTTAPPLYSLELRCRRRRAAVAAATAAALLSRLPPSPLPNAAATRCRRPRSCKKTALCHQKCIQMEK
uniref:Uncharacterized protein n=1 Tax=Oryza sativa subsp. japonica TaxID=39947 RepID=Q6Z9S6_ORYSJ|nr:hypothetical protein [Oryza sativa Japonica Group]BAD09852.1 hypothetical protein [Oryza sativa Japonica Group]